MRVEGKGSSVDVITSWHEMLEGAGIVVLAVAAVALAGGLIGLGLIAAVLFAAIVMHSAFLSA